MPDSLITSSSTTRLFSLVSASFEDLHDPGTAECYRGFKELGKISYSGAEERVWALQFDKLETQF